jgi:hypothetical protein
VSRLENIDLIPLSHAVLCENCGQLSCGRTDRCIGCGSSATMSLTSILRAAASHSPAAQPQRSASHDSLEAPAVPARSSHQPGVTNC